MLNVHDLERRWLRYKIKSHLPLAGGIFAGLVTLILILIFTGEDSTIENKTTTKEMHYISEKSNIPLNQVVEVNIQRPATVQTTAHIDVPQNTQVMLTKSNTYPVDTNTLVLKPSLHFMDNIEEGLNPYLNDEDEPVTNNASTSPYISPSVYNYNSQNRVNKPIQKRPSLIIKTDKKEADLKDVIRRFKKNKNPALSLFIAKRYYELGQYQKSYNYALMTNEINKDIVDSWLIFSKSLVKLKQKKLAVLTLKSYLKHNKSTQIEVLLRKIEGGTFK